MGGPESRAGDGVGDGPVPGLRTRTTPPASAPQTPRRPGGRGSPRSRSAPTRSRSAPAINGLLDAEGWALAAATGSVFGRWPQIVGADLAAHTTPETLTDGELTVTADSTAWATQVRLLAAQLVRRLNGELGDGTVLAGQGPGAGHEHEEAR